MRQDPESNPPQDCTEQCLCDLGKGECARITGCRLEKRENEMLRALGLRPNAQVQITRAGEPCIIRITDNCGYSCSLGISRDVAKSVTVSRTEH